ncbi:hypothetical protein M885DRAFT_524129 [Pelagophyceae sp. CCMP2097]|nr:hypothetical protein M885DRAFT_524129 [Pelagophyceae sp. CCMP2097]
MNKQGRVRSGGAPSSKLASMLRVEPAAARGPRIVEVGEDGEFDLSEAAASEAAAAPAEAEPSMMDLMMADAAEHKAAKVEVAVQEQSRMKASFGDGMKSGLKRGFFDKKPAKAKAPAKAPAKAATASDPVVNLKKQASSGDSISDAIKKEVAANLAADQHPMAKALKDGAWVTPGLVEQLGKRPLLQKRMSDPRCQKALEQWQLMLKTDPKKAATMFEQDAELKAFIMEFSEVMGEHFASLEPQKSAEAAPPPADFAAAGPMAAEIARLAAEGRGPKRPKDAAEQAEVDAVMSNAALRGLLMDHGTQALMQACADPRQFSEAMRDPAKRTVIAKLEKAGLVRLMR